MLMKDNQENVFLVHEFKMYDNEQYIFVNIRINERKTLIIFTK